MELIAANAPLDTVLTPNCNACAQASNVRQHVATAARHTSEEGARVAQRIPHDIHCHDHAIQKKRAVTDAALDAVKAFPRWPGTRTAANVLCMRSSAERSMGFLNQDHFGKAAQCTCSLSFRSVVQDCAVEHAHVRAKCKNDVHGNFISCACARCGDLCSHCDRASATAESAGRPAHPPFSFTLSRRQRTLELPLSLQDFALLQMRTNVSRQWIRSLHLSHPSPLCRGLLKIALVSFPVPRARLLWLAQAQAHSIVM